MDEQTTLVAWCMVAASDATHKATDCSSGVIQGYVQAGNRALSMTWAACLIILLPSTG